MWLQNKNRMAIQNDWNVTVLIWKKNPFQFNDKCGEGFSPTEVSWGGEEKSPLRALACLRFSIIVILLGCPVGARLQAVSCFSFESQFESMCEGQDMSSEGGGGGELRIWKGRECLSEILKETDLGVAQAFLDP